MALALVCCSIEADQGGTQHARARVILVSWEGRSHALLFMVPLGPPSVRPMAQALWLPFEYYYYYDSNECYKKVPYAVFSSCLCTFLAAVSLLSVKFFVIAFVLVYLAIVEK